MPTIETIDLAERLESMANQLMRQGVHPALGAHDAVDLRGAAAELRRLRGEVERLREAGRRAHVEATAIRDGLGVKGIS